MKDCPGREGSVWKTSNMSEEFSGSLTPPFSPYFSENPELGGSQHCTPPRFSCAQDGARDGGKSFPFDSYVTSGSLKR